MVLVQLQILVLNLFAMFAFSLAGVASAQDQAAKKYTKIPVEIPTDIREYNMGARRFGDGVGQGCNYGQIVKTCDANTSSVMPKGKFLSSPRLVLGSGVAGSSSFAKKFKTKCIANVALDSSGLEGCVYNGCFGYTKPIEMVCMSK
jgi:hypothetical protein